MTAFVPARSRDAWPTIRGFVYQVDVTLERWIGLENGAELVLECGEDIDRVVVGLASDEERALEQVKVRDGAVSLRSAEALEALANAADHLVRNPTVPLRFRFTTTAKIGREKNHPVPEMAPGLVLWENIRQKTESQKTEEDVLSTIGGILALTTRPRRIPAPTWANARFLFGDLERLADLIRRFEWATAEPHPDDRSACVVDALISSGLVAERSRAVEKYEQLFGFVFRVLSRRGLKVLRRADLDTELARSSASEADRALFVRVRSRLHDLGIRLEALEQRVERIDAAVASAFGLPSNTLAMTTPLFDVEPPPLTQTLATRAPTVTRFRDTSATWLAIRADAGMGKSHLALLILRSMERSPVWIRLGRLSAEAAADRLLRTLAAWGGIALTDSRLVIGQVVERLKADNCSLVLDDVPSSGRDELLTRLILQLVQGLQGRPVTLVTTSHKPPIEAGSIVGTSCSVQECPSFDEADAAELLTAFGGGTFVERHPGAVASLTVVTRGHPTLLSAAAAFLRTRQWAWDSSNLAGILQGAYATEINAQTRAAVLSTVSDTETRELLDRLKVHTGDFDSDIVHALASVTPPLARAIDLLHLAEGIWIQRSGQARWRLSPLLAAIPESGLPPQVERDCHAALARQMLDGSVDQASGLTVVSHWLKAGQADKAGITLRMLIDALVHHEPRVPSGFLLDMWWMLPLPKDMSRGVQILLRHSQVRAGALYGKDSRFILRDLDRLLNAASEVDAWAVVVVETSRFRERFAADPTAAGRSFERALSARSRARLPDGAAYPVPDLAPLVWLEASAIVSRGHLAAWLRCVESLPLEGRAWQDGMVGAEAMCRSVCDHIWLREDAKPHETANWADAHEQLDMVLHTARRIDFPYLEACALRGKITLLFEREGKVDEAVLAASTFLKRHDIDAKCTVLIEDVLGRQYYHAGRHVESMVHLRRALQHAPGVEPYLLCLTANYASRASAALNTGEALSFARQAVEISQRDADLPQEAELIARGELALACWYDGDRKACAEALLGAGEYFNGHCEDQVFLRHVGLTFIQAVVCLTKALNSPAGNRVDGPFPGRAFFHEQPWKAAARWRDDSPEVLAYQLCQVAEAAGNDDATQKWAERAFVRGATGTEHTLSPRLQLTILPHLLLSGRPEAAVALMEHLSAVLDQLRSHPSEELPLSTIEGGAGWAAWLGLIPSALTVAIAVLDDRKAAEQVAKEVLRCLASIESGTSERDVWKVARDLFEMPYSGSSHRAPLSLSDQRLNNAPNAGLNALAYIQATMCDDVPLDVAVRIHGDVFPALCVSWPMRAVTRVVDRFIDRYWTSAFRRARFAFRSPTELARQIDALASLSVEVRSRKLLRLTSEALGVPLRPSTRAWCDAVLSIL